MNINSLNCSVCGVPVRERTVRFDGGNDSIYVDSDNMPCSETPRFHDHDADWEPVAEEPAFFDLLRPEPQAAESSSYKWSAEAGRYVADPDASPISDHLDLTEALAAAERVANRGFGPAGQQTKEGAERAQAEYQIAQNTLALQVAHCRYCKGAKTRAWNKMNEAIAQDAGTDLIEAYHRKAVDARCREHAQRGRLNFACSPVSENYWCS